MFSNTHGVLWSLSIILVDTSLLCQFQLFGHQSFKLLRTLVFSYKNIFGLFRSICLFSRYVEVDNRVVIDSLFGFEFKYLVFRLFGQLSAVVYLFGSLLRLLFCTLVFVEVLALIVIWIHVAVSVTEIVAERCAICTYLWTNCSWFGRVGHLMKVKQVVQLCSFLPQKLEVVILGPVWLGLRIDHFDELGLAVVSICVLHGLHASFLNFWIQIHS